MKDNSLIDIQNAEARISTLLKTPPPHSSWGYQRAVNFKEVCKLAMGYLGRQKKNLKRMIEIEQQLRSYF